MDDIWIISWFNHTACDANPIWKSPIKAFGFFAAAVPQEAASTNNVGSSAIIFAIPIGVQINSKM